MCLQEGRGMCLQMCVAVIVSQRLQDEVELQQNQVIGLHNMVVVVDETNSDDGESQLLNM